MLIIVIVMECKSNIFWNGYRTVAILAQGDDLKFLFCLLNQP